MKKDIRRGTRRLRVIAAGVALLMLPTAALGNQPGPATTLQCRPEGALVRVPDLVEGSGVAASTRSPGRLWTHNDGSDSTLFAVTAQGEVAGRLRVDGVRIEDWEAVGVGGCASGSCIYVADIGDNDAERPHVTIYRFPEPAEPSGTAAGVEAIRATYPDGAHNAETLLVTPSGDVLIVTKGDTGPVAIYRLPADAKPGSTVKLEAIGTSRELRKGNADERITDGAVSPDGAWIALRTNTSVMLYRAGELLAGNWREASRVSLKTLGEPQGEGIAFGDDRTLYLIGEGGGKKRPGTFARLTCSL